MSIQANIKPIQETIFSRNCFRNALKKDNDRYYRSENQLALQTLSLDLEYMLSINFKFLLK